MAFITVLGAFLSSCLQMRMTEKRQSKKIVTAGHQPEFGLLNGHGRDIHYTLVGRDTSKAMLVFVHGSPGSSSNFLSFAKDSTLLERFQVLLLDRPGFGYSDFGRAEHSMLKQASILNAVQLQFAAPKKILIGHSLGGPIIARMAMDSAAHVHGILIVAGSVDPELEPEEKWRKPMDKPWLSWILPRSFRVSNREIMQAKQDLIAMENDWHKITAHAVVIQGGEDNLVPPGNADYAEKKLTNAKSLKILRFAKLNHFIPFSKPEVMTKEILGFPMD